MYAEMPGSCARLENGLVVFLKQLWSHSALVHGRVQGNPARRWMERRVREGMLVKRILT